VRYFADRRLYSHGPKAVTGTFGIALLSKYPFRNRAPVQLREQTARIAAGGRRADFQYLRHPLGNGGRSSAAAVLADIDEKRRDRHRRFWFKPDSEQYMLTTGLLADAGWRSGRRYR
jgi:hypothetical protein